MSKKHVVSMIHTPLPLKASKGLIKGNTHKNTLRQAHACQCEFWIVLRVVICVCDDATVCLPYLFVHFFTQEHKHVDGLVVDK